MRPVTATQFWPSALQMVGRLPGMVTVAAAGGGMIAPLTGIAALALASVAVALALALASSALALALAAADVVAAVCFCNLSSFCSINFSCCLSSAISVSALAPDSAWACETNNAPIRLAAVAIPVVLNMRIPFVMLDEATERYDLPRAGFFSFLSQTS